jgi:hypothetical protein
MKKPLIPVEDLKAVVRRLVAASVLSPTSAGRKRGQVYEARDVIGAFTALKDGWEARLGDTQIGRPVRPVPKF